MFNFNLNTIHAEMLNLMVLCSHRNDIKTAAVVDTFNNTVMVLLLNEGSNR